MTPITDVLFFSSTRETVVPALVEKCFGAMKAGTKQSALTIILLYVEIDTANPVVVRFYSPFILFHYG